jgi:ankyrin repeat protein
MSRLQLGLPNTGVQQSVATSVATKPIKGGVVLADVAPKLPAVSNRLSQLFNPSLLDLLRTYGFAANAAASKFSASDAREIVASLAQLGAPTHDSAATWSLLHAACVCGDAKSFHAVLSLIRQRIVEPNQAGPDGDTLLHSVARCGVERDSHTDFLAQVPISLKQRIHDLVESGANPALPNSQGALVLQLALERESVDGRQIVDVLLKVGVDPAQHNAQGWSMLDRAAAEGDLPVLRGLIAVGVNPDLRSARRLETPTMLAAAVNQASSIDVLIQLGATVNAIDAVGLTALHIAVNTESIESIKMLLKHGADLHGRPENGSVPFGPSPLASSARHAAVTGDDSMLQLMLEAGADPDLVFSENGMSARDTFAYYSGGRDWPQ